MATRSRVLRAGIAQATLGYAITGLGACIVLLARDLAVAPQRLAWLPATFGAGLLVVAATGPVLLRGGPGRALVGGSLVLATGVTVLALAPALLLAVLGALLLGVGGAAFVLVTPALLAGPEAAVQLSRVVGVSSAAAVLAPGAIGALDASGVVGGRFALLAAVPPLLFLAWNAREPEPPPPPLPAARPAAGPVARRWIVVVLAVSVEFCFTIWAVARLADSGLTPSRAAVFGTAFPIGMAVGRLAAPAVLGRIPVVPTGAAVTAAGAVVVAAAGHPAVVIAGLLVAGAGIATLYPVTLAALTGTPGLSGAHAASLGALASGTAILAAPAALARVADVTGLRPAFLITVPLLALLLVFKI
ncbi:hypothetical protein Asp14428_70740 [Actinoplanes sp. NBRC 14428]|nr:hypothetical protein Asp14428_70740 [Actinoplanes sp. NBRC 14428]